MNGLQIFAFVVLPLAVAAIGWLAAFAVARGSGADESGEQPKSAVSPHRP